jgi:hypothetical protein
MQQMLANGRMVRQQGTTHCTMGNAVQSVMPYNYLSSWFKSFFRPCLGVHGKATTGIQDTHHQLLLHPSPLHMLLFFPAAVQFAV